jgi:fumarylacetoacetate (FAA) hydrolase family protein
MTHDILPKDNKHSTLVGRIWQPNEVPSLAGPAIVTIADGQVYDLTTYVSTCAQLMATPDRLKIIANAQQQEPLCSLESVLSNSTAENRAPGLAYFISPIDLQCIKAAGVTFANSLLERIIEERAGGDFSQAKAIRDELAQAIGNDLSNVKPGSAEAKQVEKLLREKGLWSQYLEVGIGPDAEIFTKAPVLSSVGYGQYIGINPASEWSNPEPEVVLVVNPDLEPVGAMLGNDVNLRDFEGRSALLLARGKDNNASCALGPFIRLFDQHFDLDDVRKLDVTVRVEGEDDYILDGTSSMTAISRDVYDLVKQTADASHQYPDGFVLMTGTLFAPTQDRGTPDMGFTHHLGDKVMIASDKLGTLCNTVTTSDKAPPWHFGITALMRNLQQRGLL